jgi:hypothetical protein
VNRKRIRNLIQESRKLQKPDNFISDARIEIVLPREQQINAVKRACSEANKNRPLINSEILGKRQKFWARSVKCGLGTNSRLKSVKTSEEPEKELRPSVKLQNKNR